MAVKNITEKVKEIQEMSDSMVIRKFFKASTEEVIELGKDVRKQLGALCKEAMIEQL